MADPDAAPKSWNKFEALSMCILGPIFLFIVCACLLIYSVVSVIKPLKETRRKELVKKKKG